MAVEDALRGLVDAWNAGDAESFAKRFAPDAEYTTGAGQSVRGRARIAALVVGAEKVALVDGPSVECDGKTARGRFGWATAARRGNVTCKLAWQGGAWLIESLCNDEAGESRERSGT